MPFYLYLYHFISDFFFSSFKYFQLFALLSQFIFAVQSFVFLEGNISRAFSFFIAGRVVHKRVEGRGEREIF